jgi:beta-xylosidase
MKAIFLYLLIAFLIPINVPIAFGQIHMLNVKDIRIRDPFIYVDSNTKQYFLISSQRMPDGKDGVGVYISKDLKNWAPPVNVLTLPENFHEGCQVWAPEMHEYKGKYYLFLTLTYDEKLANHEKPKDAESWMPLVKRGSQIFWSDNLLGPFKPLSDKFTLRDDWMTLDGTLYVEDNVPYMVFCHEWVQVGDGTIDLIKLSDDLSTTVGTSKILFKASDAPWVINLEKKVPKKVTDGPFIYKSKTNQLIMIWSSFSKTGYSIGQAVSVSGKIEGPWKQNDKLIFERDGGHGMIFRTLDGRLMLSIHQPNSVNERLNLFELNDCGSYVEIIP